MSGGQCENSGEVKNEVVEHSRECKECVEYNVERVSIDLWEKKLMPYFDKRLDELMQTKREMEERVDTLHFDHWPIRIFGKLFYAKSYVDFALYILIVIFIFKQIL